MSGVTNIMSDAPSDEATQHKRIFSAPSDKWFVAFIFKFAFMGKFLQLYRFVPVVLLVSHSWQEYPSEVISHTVLLV